MELRLEISSSHLFPSLLRGKNVWVGTALEGRSKTAACPAKKKCPAKKNVLQKGDIFQGTVHC